MTSTRVYSGIVLSFHSHEAHAGRIPIHGVAFFHRAESKRGQRLGAGFLDLQMMRIDMGLAAIIVVACVATFAGIGVITLCVLAFGKRKN